MGCTFPEVLARDLEKSEAIFASKHMTSGSPSSAVAAVDRDLHYNLHDGMPSPHKPSSPCRPRHGKRARSCRGLRDLEEESEPELPSPPLSPTALGKRSEEQQHHWKQQQQQQHHHQQEPHTRPRQTLVAQADVDAPRRSMDDFGDAVISPWLSEHGPGSSSSSESLSSSFEMEPIPMRRRHQSVTTTATSVTSGRRSSSISNRQPLTSPAHGPAESWVDLEPDSADAHTADSDTGTDVDTIDHAYAPAGAYEPAPSISDIASIVQGGLSVPRRRSSLQHVLSPKPLEEYQFVIRSERPCVNYSRRERPISPTSRTPNEKSHYTVAPDAIGGQQMEDVASSVCRPVSQPASDPGDAERGFGEYRDSFDADHKPGSKSFKAVRWNGPAKSDVSLDPTVGMAFAAPLRSAPDVGASAPPIPLPPDVIETLMVSTACFPETMLLCSSLSIETIRAYSRKLRRLHSLENAEARSLLLATPSSPSSSVPAQRSPSPHKRWRLANILSKRSSADPDSFPQGPSYHSRNNLHGKNHRSIRGDLSTTKKPARTHYQGSLVCPDFARFKTVFPGAADYLCDALYAHIVAYNYITLLCDAAAVATAAANMSAMSDYCPRPSFSSTPSFPPRRGSSTSGSSAGGGHDDTNRKIPKKAAHLLGLENGLDPVGPGRLDAAASTSPSTAAATQASIVRANAIELGAVDLGGAASGIDAASMGGSRHRRTLTMGSSSSANRLKSKRRGRDGSISSVPPPSRGGTAGTFSAGGGSNKPHNGPESEASLRNLRDALSRCVANLITTIKLTTEPSAPTAAAGPGLGGVMRHDEVDPWLVRALCEMVRCCEGAS